MLSGDSGAKFAISLSLDYANSPFSQYIQQITVAVGLMKYLSGMITFN